jgi:N-acetylneuraminic acid mutarotase
MGKTGVIAGMILPAAFAWSVHWDRRADLPIPLAGGYAFAFEKGVIYAGGATWRDGVKEYRADVHLYDASSDKWNRIPSLPLPLAYGAAVSTSQGIEILGGISTSRVYRQSLRLQASTKTWLMSGALPADTLLARAEAVRDEVYLFGGCGDLADLTTCSDSVWMRREKKWERVASLPKGPLAVAASAALGHAIYLFGGCSTPSKGTVVNHNEAWRFDTRKREWKQLQSSPRPVRGLSAVALDGQRILLVGGYAASQQEAEGKPADYGFSSDALIYDAVTDRYLPTTSLPVAAATIGLVNSGPRIYAVGGEDRMKGRSPRVFSTSAGGL